MTPFQLTCKTTQLHVYERPATDNCAAKSKDCLKEQQFIHLLISLCSIMTFKSRNCIFIAAYMKTKS